MYQDSKTVKLQKPIKKIFYLYPAANETYVVLTRRSHISFTLDHIDKDGKELKSFNFEKPMDTIAMMDEN